MQVSVGIAHSLPQEKDLPSGLTQLARLNAAAVFSGEDFHKHTDRLIKRIEDIVGPVSVYRQLLNRWWRPN